MYSTFPSSASGTNLGIVEARGEELTSGRVEGDDDAGVEIRESQGLGTLGLSDSDSPNIQVGFLCFMWW